MKKYRVAFVNVIFILLIMLVVITYVNNASRTKREDRIREFEDVTVGLVQTTENYLYGAQQIANSWAHYINSRNMTIEEAIDFMRSARVDATNVNGQILFLDQRENVGLSTMEDSETPGSYEVHYSEDLLFGKLEEEAPEVEDVRIRMTRIFTNQVNGKQSVAFYHPVYLRNPANEGTRSAVVLYVIPVSAFEYNLKITNTYFQSASSVIVTKQGDYISKNPDFKNSNVFEFFNSYNNYTMEEFNALKESVDQGHGSFDALDNKKELAHIAYASENDDDGFVVVSMLRDRNLIEDSTDVRVSVTIGVGLLILFCFNLLMLKSTNNRLNKAVQEADKANQAKTEFLSTMSHDIRTPLNAILGFTTLAIDQKDNPEAVAKNLTKISVAGNHLRMLINDILDISQIENDSLRLEPSVVAVDELLTTIQSIADPIAEDKKIALDLHLEQISHPYIYADQLRLNQIYVNLVGNSLKYTNSGGKVSMCLSEAPTDDPYNVKLQAVIADTGIGMEASFLPRMFDSFAREEDGRTSKISGTGLGLAITKHLVDLMKGSIVCESEIGKGSTFTVVIEVPIAEAPVSVSDSAKTFHMGSTHALVAEDNDLNWEIISSMLELKEVLTDRAVNGQEAIDLLKENPDKYDLVLMDVRMPVMNGIEATKKIRADADRRIRKIPIVAVSADAFTESLEECKKAGMNAHVAKPIQIQELMNIIAKVKEGKL